MIRRLFLGIVSAAALFAQTPSPPLTVDLANAIERAKAFSPQFQAATLAAQSAREDITQARAARLPNLNILNGYTVTQGNGTDTGVFVANNGVNLFDEQALVHAELFSKTKNALYKQTQAAEAVAQARTNVARRGLIATVIQSYYGVVAAQRHIVNAERGLMEARDFETLTGKQEAGGEVAHSDVVRAQFQTRQRERDLAESHTNLDKAKFELAALLFQDLGQPYNVVDDLKADAALASGDEVSRLALANNPDLTAAQASVQAARFGVLAAQGQYYPSLMLDYAFGIDSNAFALRNKNGNLNLGSTLAATVTVPVWNFGSIKSKVKQSQLVQQQAQNDLKFAQRQIQASAGQFQIEATAARSQLTSLKDSSTLAEQYLKLTIERYQAGEASALEVVDAQGLATDSRNAYDDGLTRYRLALANIETLTGRY